MGEARKDALRHDFDRRLKLEFHGTKVTSDTRLLVYRELDEAPNLTLAIAPELRDIRTGKSRFQVNECDMTYSKVEILMDDQKSLVEVL